MNDLKPCPFCGGGVTMIEGGGMIWRGVSGYSDPQYFTLQHYGNLDPDDSFPSCNSTIRHRTEAQAIAAWNNRKGDTK